jgi:hypothetical protein
MPTLQGIRILYLIMPFATIVTISTLVGRTVSTLIMSSTFSSQLQEGLVPNLGPRLRVLEPSPIDADMSTLESSVTMTTVGSLRRGMVVMEIGADNFADLLFDAGRVMQEHYVVLSTGGDKVVLQKMRDRTSYCLRDPKQRVHALNNSGIGMLGGFFEGAYQTIPLCAPGLLSYILYTLLDHKLF